MFITDATHLPRLMQCFGSSQMPQVVPYAEDDTTSRDEGNAAHYMAQQVFNGVATIEQLTGHRAYNGVIMDAEMARHVTEYLSTLHCGQMEYVTSFGNDRWQINARTDHVAWRCHPNDQYQTPDEIIVDDFKYGRRLVEPEMNWTLIAHAIGYCLREQITPSTIRLRIYQPRRHHPDGPLREWLIDYLTLRSLYQQIDERLSAGDTTLRTGPNCVKCHAAATCPAWRESSMNAIDAASVLFNDELPAEALSRELDLLAHAETVITERHKALKELALHRSRNGEVIPMYAGETQYANRRFKFDAATIRAITGVEPTEPKLVTPAELSRRGVADDILNLITERPTTGVKLIRSDPSKRAERLLKKGKSNAR